MKHYKIKYALLSALLSLILIVCTACAKNGNAGSEVNAEAETTAEAETNAESEIATAAEDEAEYEVIRKVGDKLYEVTFDTYEENEERMIEHLDDMFEGEAPGCTSIWKDGMLMRNLDWYLKDGGVDVCELVVHTTANEGRYATVGVCYNPNITDENYDSIEEIKLKTLPFMLVDGMNSEGLMFGQNVCPETDGVSNTYGTNPDGDDLPYYTLGRQLLDHCANVDEAIEYLRNHNIFMNDKKDGTRMESHFLVADKNRAVVIEFVNDKLIVLEQDNLPYDEAFITNHYVYNGGVNTGHGMGFERDEVVKAGYDSVTDWKSGMGLLEELRYTKAYTLPLGEDFWYSEYYVHTSMDGKDYDFNGSTPHDDPDFLKFIASKQEAYANRADECWHSNHSSVYNSEDSTLHLVVRENFDKVYEFGLSNLITVIDNQEGEKMGSTGNPHEAEWIDEEMSKSLDSIKRVDDKGVFYEMNYTADYYGDTIIEQIEKTANALDSGCSVFSTYNTDHDFLMCRNYDYRHKDANGDATGLNVLLNLAPEGKLKSIGVCDAFWLNPKEYYAGALDDGETDTSMMLLAPYMCVDGMNEAGLAASLLVADVKEGETLTDQNTGKLSITHSMLLRCIIDNAHNIEEAVEIAENYDIYSTGGTDLHMYLSQKDGSSAVFEWRQYENDEKQKLYVTYTNAVTNFYAGFDDGEDAYRPDGSLKEKCVRISPTYNNYKYGYGHGYHRFNQIISTLERYIEDDVNEYGIRNSVMEENQALDVLRVIAQGPGIENTSFTQFSAIYNLDDLSVTLWMQRDYDKSYGFTLK